MLKKTHLITSTTLSFNNNTMLLTGGAVNGHSVNFCLLTVLTYFQHHQIINWSFQIINWSYHQHKHYSMVYLYLSQWHLGHLDRHTNHKKNDWWKILKHILISMLQYDTSYLNCPFVFLSSINKPMQCVLF